MQKGPEGKRRGGDGCPHGAGDALSPSVRTTFAQLSDQLSIQQGVPDGCPGRQGGAGVAGRRRAAWVISAALQTRRNALLKNSSHVSCFYGPEWPWEPGRVRDVPRGSEPCCAQKLWFVVRGLTQDPCPSELLLASARPQPCETTLRRGSPKSAETGEGKAKEKRRAPVGRLNRPSGLVTQAKQGSERGDAQARARGWVHSEDLLPCLHRPRGFNHVALLPGMVASNQPAHRPVSSHECRKVGKH